ncbi:MAG: alpha/beta hydrolase, partial [Deltaproteobacteria bacterium]|nr:alpha/beta hydrolase [Deltaproteobacteria bacterium]
MFAKVNGVNLFYEKSGSGPPLLLLHGNSEDHRVFDKIVVKLANHFTVYALDSREQGASEKTGQFSYALMAEDVYAFVVDLGLGQVNLAGFSDGAIVGLLLGLSRPQILKKMILMGPNLKPGDLTDEAVAFLRELEAQGDYPLFRVIFKEPDIELSSLKNVKVPCLVVAGENDLF